MMTNRFLLGLLFSFTFTLYCTAQKSPVNNNQEIKMTDVPIDGIVKESILQEKRILSYDHIREADIFWEKKIWRVIDTREKMNQVFSYPNRSFFEIIKDAVEEENLRAYSVENDQFQIPLRKDEIRSILYSTDTVEIIDPKTFVSSYQIVENILNDSDVNRYRIKEVWFFDEERSTMDVRILGIAPIIDEYNDQGEFMYERPLFWVYYPHLRAQLASEEIFMPGNDAARISWEQLFEMRLFSSHIYKESNIKDLRLKDMYSGLDKMLESQKIGMEIFNFEHDLWSH